MLMKWGADKQKARLAGAACRASIQAEITIQKTKIKVK
jgi:hypothetical protein